MGLLSDKIQAEIINLRASGKHQAAIHEIIKNFDHTPLISSDFPILNAIFMDATTDLQAVAGTSESVWLSGMLLEKYAVLSLYTGKCGIWMEALETVDDVSDELPEIKNDLEPLSLRYILRTRGVEAAMSSLGEPEDLDIETPKGAVYMHSLLETLVHSLNLKYIEQLPRPEEEWIRSAKPETRLWYSILFYIAEFLKGENSAMDRLHDLTTLDFGGETPIAENSIIRAVFAGWQVLNGDVEDAAETVDKAFGTITEPFWDDNVRYFPEVLFPVFWSELDIDDAEDLLIRLISALNEDTDLMFPALVAGIMLLGIYGAQKDYFSWYATLRTLNAITGDIEDVDTGFLDLGISSLESIIGTPKLMIYHARYENSI